MQGCTPCVIGEANMRHTAIHMVPMRREDLDCEGT